MSDDVKAAGRTTFERGLDEVREASRTLRQPPGLTLSTVAALVERAISYGAGIFNEGGPRECYLLYAEAARLVVEASEGAEFGHRTSDALDDLTRALGRAADAEDSEAAWIMRHAFDKTIVMQQLAAEGVQWMLKLGEAAFARGDYEGSVEALRSGVDFARDVLAPSRADEPLQAAQLAHLYYGHGLMLTRRWAAAAEWLRRGVLTTPQLPQIDFDMRSLGPRWIVFAQRLDELEVMEDDDPNLDHARLLRSYFYIFSGQRRRAADILMAMMQRDLDDEVVQFLFALTVEGDAEA